MIVVSKESNVNTWWIAYNEDKSIVHYGLTEPPQQTDSGLTLKQTFTNELDWLNVLNNEFSIVIEE